MCEEEGSIRSFFGAVDGRVVLTNIFVDVNFWPIAVMFSILNG